jgi:hypothetical protein
VDAGNDARSRKWTIYGSYDAIGLSYGTIGIVPLLGFCDGSEEGSQKMGFREAILCSI